MIDHLESVMLKLLHWFANRRRPDTVEDDQFQWVLTTLFGFKIAVSMVFRSEDEDDFRPHIHEVWWIVLAGSYLARIRPNPSKITITLDQVDAFAYRHSARNALFNIELPPARDFEDAMIRFRWMSVPELIFDAQKPVWLLVVSRG